MNKTKSIVVFALVAVFVILMAVFSVIEFESGLYDYTGFARTIKLGLDLSGGVVAEYNVIDDGEENFDARVDGTIDSLQSLLTSKGYTEAQVTYQNQRIRIEVPDVDDPDRIFDLIGRPATLEFRSSTDSSDYEVLITGKDHLETAYLTTDEDGYYAVGLKFNAVGTTKFAKVTEEYTGKSIYIYVNGENITSGGVSVNTTITGGSAIITGKYDYDKAYDLATQIQAGTFGVELELIESKVISASLGSNTIKNSLIAGAIGLVIILVFMAIAYRMLGVAADLALLAYIVVLLWFYAVFPWVQLTLPGVAGVLLGIGMAVDANIVIFERIKDEYRHTTKAIPASIKDGFGRATATVIDGNVTTIIGAIVMWIVGTSSVQGFAITLLISIVISMLTALLLTRLLINAMLPWNSTSPKLYGLKKDVNAKDEEVSSEEILKVEVASDEE